MTRALVVLVLAAALPAHALTVVTVGKQATFRTGSALVRVGRDPAFATPGDPTCARGDATKVQVASYPQATNRVVATADTTLPCAQWRRAGTGFRYDDPDGSVLGVQRIRYGRSGLVLRFGGAHYVPPSGPVGYAEVWITVGSRRLNVRFHNLRTNTATLLVARKPSAPAAAGEAAFWAVLHGDDHTEAREQQAMKLLARAARLDRHDGWSPFLLGMMHLYRFAAQTTDFPHASAAAVSEIQQASQAFAGSLPATWDGQHGDSRVPGFIAATKFMLGYVTHDDAVESAGLHDLDVAIAVNEFFNVFDLIPVVQVLPRTDPVFVGAVDQATGYLTAPGTLQCPNDQPEICSNAGLAPRNLSGSLLLFGDIYAKAGSLADAQTWYGLAGAVTSPGYRFQSIVDDRLANGAARVAAYLDDDPTNDPPVVGAGPEACASCHNR